MNVDTYIYIHIDVYSIHIYIYYIYILYIFKHIYIQIRTKKYTVITSVEIWDIFSHRNIWLLARP